MQTGLQHTIRDSVSKSLGKPFASKSPETTTQIVVSDADIVTNSVSPSTGPLPMGELPMESYRFANREFFLNCIDYLVTNSGIFAARNKDFTLRLLDKKKVSEQLSKWQLINIAGPLFLILIFGLLYQWRRNKKYG